MSAHKGSSAGEKGTTTHESPTHTPHTHTHALCSSSHYLSVTCAVDLEEVLLDVALALALDEGDNEEGDAQDVQGSRQEGPSGVKVPLHVVAGDLKVGNEVKGGTDLGAVPHLERLGGEGGVGEEEDQQEHLHALVAELQQAQLQLPQLAQLLLLLLHVDTRVAGNAVAHLAAQCGTVLGLARVQVPDLWRKREVGRVSECVSKWGHDLQAPHTT